MVQPCIPILAYTIPSGSGFYVQSSTSPYRSDPRADLMQQHPSRRTREDGTAKIPAEALGVYQGPQSSNPDLGLFEIDAVPSRLTRAILGPALHGARSTRSRA